MELKPTRRDKDQQLFYLILMISAYAATLGFSYFYYQVGARFVSYYGLIAFSLFAVYGVSSFFTQNLLILFRLSILTALVIFFTQTFNTGGSLSPAAAEFVIPPLLAFFYRPVYDRYIFMVLSAICLMTMWPLTTSGLTQDLVLPEFKVQHSVITTLFVFLIVAVFTFLFRYTLAKENKKLTESMTDLKTTTQKLIQAEKMASLGVMSAGVAHEINNPLNFIKGGVGMLSKSLEKSEELKPFVEAIEEGVSRASLIVSSLGHFSRSTDSMDEECDIHSIIENCLVMLQHKLKYKVEVVKKFTNSKHLRIVGNEGKLHQAILNIISNAEQAIQSKGTITIETKAKLNSLRLTISDTGVGISEENLSKISDPFFTTKPSGKGTGLGLSISFGIIQEHSGKISVTSKPSEGTRFNILFKLSERFK
ncbi:MAG: ATP-binding protein [Cyclobacteriaceae bacterium]